MGHRDWVSYLILWQAILDKSGRDFSIQLGIFLFKLTFLFQVEGFN